MYLPMVIAAEMTGRLCKKNNQLSLLLRNHNKCIFFTVMSMLQPHKKDEENAEAMTIYLR